MPKRKERRRHAISGIGSVQGSALPHRHGEGATLLPQRDQGHSQRHQTRQHHDQSQ